jgi:1-deoxy-D-xylulose-5-phosphate synthase
VRYPRGSTGITTGSNSEKELKALPFGQAQQTREATGDDKKVALLVFGTLLTTAMEVAEELDATVYNMRFVKPLDTRTIDEARQQHDLLVTIEDNAIAGGAGSAVTEYLNQQHVSVNLLQIGFPDEYIQHGQPEELLADWKLDKAGMLGTIQNRINATITPGK